MNSVTIISHPLVACHLAVLRDRTTPPGLFRQSVQQLATQLAWSATTDLNISSIEVETPICKTSGCCVDGRIGLVPILRAGVSMVDAMLGLIPTAEVWHLGLYRDEKTAQPIGYYNKLADSKPVDIAFVLDPMLATGGSAAMACHELQQWGVQKIKMLSIISAPEGVERLQSEFPEIGIHTCVVDEKLNDRKFIVPGLGDAGDRIYNTVG